MKNIIDFYNENGYYIFKDVFTTPVSLTSNLLCPLSLVMENNVPVFVSEKAAMEVELDDSIFNTPWPSAFDFADIVIVDELPTVAPENSIFGSFDWPVFGVMRISLSELAIN